MNRIDRISAILIQLQTKKYVTAGEIACRFGTSKRTIYRDLKSLEEAGVPIGAEAGRGYFIVDGFHLPPVMFSKEEASSMLTAEKIVEKMADISVIEQFKSAMFKIKSVLPDREKQFLDRLDHNVEVFYVRPDVSPDVPNNFILDIQQALANKKILRLAYRSGNCESLIPDRMVEPLGLCFYSMTWHLVGYCRYRNDYRDFRLDRIRELQVTEEGFHPGKINSIREFFKQNVSRYELEHITIRFPKSKAHLIQTSRYYYGFVGEEEKEDGIYLNFVSNDVEYFCRWLLMYADEVEILSNDKLKTKFNECIERIKMRFL